MFRGAHKVLQKTFLSCLELENQVLLGVQNQLSQDFPLQYCDSRGITCPNFNCIRILRNIVYTFLILISDKNLSVKKCDLDTIQD